jgi:hypothetical protein
MSIINKFLNESENNRAIYVGFSRKNTDKLMNKI